MQERLDSNHLHRIATYLQTTMAFVEINCVIDRYSFPVYN